MDINEERDGGNITLSIQYDDKDTHTIIRSFPTDNFNDGKLKNIGKVKICTASKEKTSSSNTKYLTGKEQILIPDTKYDNTYFGYSLAVSSDGSILAVGCPGNCIEDIKGTTNGSGCVYVYKLIDGRYSLRDIVIPSTLIPNLYFGSTVRIDGNILTVGCLSLGLSIDPSSNDCRIETINLEKLSINNYKAKFKSQLKYRRR